MVSRFAGGNAAVRHELILARIPTRSAPTKIIQQKPSPLGKFVIIPLASCRQRAAYLLEYCRVGEITHRHILHGTGCCKRSAAWSLAPKASEQACVSKIGSGYQLTTCGFAACSAERLRLSVAADSPRPRSCRVEGYAFRAARTRS